ncbi:MAG: hypothetical protein CBB71_09915 [Rhodopirellula sp. TMED11]|nr:MAG: hypothetical protein CBB71_09915 [Rhodopirellula sp. TMED11]
MDKGAERRHGETFSRLIAGRSGLRFSECADKSFRFSGFGKKNRLLNPLLANNCPRSASRPLL